MESPDHGGHVGSAIPNRPKNPPESELCTRRAPLLVVALLSIVRVLPALQADSLPDGSFVVSGDIIIGPAHPEIAKGQPHQAAVFDPGGLWPGGVIPYVLDPSLSPQMIDQFQTAAAQWAARTPVRFVLRSYESVYVRVRAGSCVASLGKPASGEGVLSIDASNCAPHEMGHTIGLMHESQRRDRDNFLEMLYPNIAPSPKVRREFDGERCPNRLDIGLYDFASVMHYTSRSNGRRAAFRTRPPGIHLGSERVPSEGDLQVVSRLYNQPISGVTIETNPQGMAIEVDGRTFRAPQTFSWARGSRHTVSAPEEQTASHDARFRFGRWNDDGARTHEITVTAEQTLYSANYIELCRFSVPPVDPDMATVTVVPAPPDSLFGCDEEVTVSVAPKPGWRFAGWSPGFLPDTPSVTFIVRLAGGALTPVLTRNPVVTIQSDPPGVPLVVNGGFRYSPILIPADPNRSVNLGAREANPADGFKYEFRSWNNGPAGVATVSVPLQGGPYVARFAAHVPLLRFLVPSSGATMSATPDSSTGYFEVGTSVQFRASAAFPKKFEFWGGDVVSTDNPATITLDRPLLIYAFFSPLEAPSVQSMSVASVPAGSEGFPLAIFGSGFYPGITQVLWNGQPRAYESAVASTGTSTSGQEIRLNLLPGDLERPGAIPITIQNILGLQRPETTVTFQVVPAPAECRYSLSSLAHDAGPEGGLLLVDVVTDPQCPWGLSSPNSWTTRVTPWASRGSSTAVFSIDPNVSALPRSGRVRIAGQSVEVGQRGAPCRFRAWPGENLSARAEGGDLTVRLSSTVDACTWVATTADSWIELLSPATGRQTGTLALRVAANPSPQARTARISVGDAHLTIQQAAGVGPAFASMLGGAGFQVGAAAPEAFVTAFGTDFTDARTSATKIPLPTSLGGLELVVRDAAGVERPAPLLFVSPGQINFLVPSGTAVGQGLLMLRVQGQVRATAPLRVDRVAPGLFTANADGRGAPKGTAERLTAAGEHASESLFECIADRCDAKPLDLSVPGDTVILVLYGTGIRGRSSLEAVEATVGGTPARVLYAGAQGSEGLDQVNLAMPPGFAGSGLVDVQLVVDGKPANPVWIRIKSDASAPDPISWDFLAGTEGWAAFNLDSHRMDGGFWYLDPAGEDPYVIGPAIRAAAADYRYVKVRMAVACEGMAAIYFRTDVNDSYSEERRVNFDPKACPLCSSAPVLTHTIRMDTHRQWTRGTTITGIRLDPCDRGRAGTDADGVTIDYIRLLSLP